MNICNMYSKEHKTLAKFAALVDTPEKLWCDHRLCDVAEHRANQDLIFEAVNRNAHCLERASPELKNNPNIVYYAVTRRGQMSAACGAGTEKQQGTRVRPDAHAGDAPPPAPAPTAAQPLPACVQHCSHVGLAFSHG